MLTFLIIVLRLKIADSTGNDDTKALKIMVSLKYLCKLGRVLKMSLINCEIKLIITWSKNCVISNAATNQNMTFEITDIKTLCSRCNFISSREYLTIATIKIMIQTTII